MKSVQKMSDRELRSELADARVKIHELTNMVAKGKRVVDDFLPNIANCALQNYGELNEFMIESEQLAGEGP